MFGVSFERTTGGFTVGIGRAEVSVCRDPLVRPRFGFELLRGDGWRSWAVQVGWTFLGVSIEAPEGTLSPPVAGGAGAVAL